MFEEVISVAHVCVLGLAYDSMAFFRYKVWAVFFLFRIDRFIYLNLFKSTESATGLKALKPAANGSYLMCKSLPYYFHLLYRSTFILLSAKCMLGLFMFP